MFKSKIISNVLILIFILILILILFYQYKIENFSMRNAVFDITDKETQELITENLTNIINNHTNLIERINEKNEERRLIRIKIGEYTEIKKTIRNREYFVINKQEELAKQQEVLINIEKLKTNKLKEIEIGFPNLNNLIRDYTNNINNKNNTIYNLNNQINTNQNILNRLKSFNIYLNNKINYVINQISNLKPYKYIHTYINIPILGRKKITLKIPNTSYKSNLANLNNQKSNFTKAKSYILNPIKNLIQSNINKQREIRTLKWNIIGLKRSRRINRINLTRNLRKLNYDLSLIQYDISKQKKKIKTNENIINNNKKLINKK